MTLKGPEGDYSMMPGNQPVGAGNEKDGLNLEHQREQMDATMEMAANIAKMEQQQQVEAANIARLVELSEKQAEAQAQTAIDIAHVREEIEDLDLAA